ncbi:MAG: hypothetical protein ACD_81C00194G0010 [uncultured bacterium]|uniref:Uncharacterized protein n=1 Tax=Candidatus Wolfebacteria bacterium GW2011_GWE2_44_13 TaxID=1619017 RepID=A0A0G1H974_9BACT|nr:MAG: hypothetical protein ACD_81C00194G0010 [uncultured bacterium]KKT43926.1 MAG: hypothetical protein UW32_C0001G0518 [Candidatus Wolfebacteria bacterium GW2011_GWE2_44_13]
MTKKVLKDVQQGDPVIRVSHGFTYSQLFRNNGTVTAVTASVITCEIAVDVPRTMEFDARTGINVLGANFGWIELPCDTSEGARLTRNAIVPLLNAAERAFVSGSPQEHTRIQQKLVDGIYGMTRIRPTEGPLYERMRLLESLFAKKGYLGAADDLPDIYLDYMTP